MTYLIDIEEPEEGLKRTERIKATCMEDAELIIKVQFPSWHIVDIRECNMFDKSCGLIKFNHKHTLKKFFKILPCLKQLKFTRQSLIEEMKMMCGIHKLYDYE